MGWETRRKCERCGNYDGELRGLYLGHVDDVGIIRGECFSLLVGNLPLKAELRLG